MNFSSKNDSFILIDDQLINGMQLTPEGGLCFSRKGRESYALMAALENKLKSINPNVFAIYSGNERGDIPLPAIFFLGPEPNSIH